MQILGYIRVSTEEQANDGNSLFEQRERLQAYCKAMLWPEPIFFIDDGYSAKDTNRPDLQKLLKIVGENKTELKIMVTKLDRISRKLLDLLTMIELFQNHGASFVSVSEQFDSNTPAGRLTLQVLGAVAEFERERTRERVIDNMDSIAKNTNKALTRPCFGYDIVDGEYQINNSEQKFGDMMLDLAESGDGYRMIAKKLNDAGSRTKKGKPWDQKNVKRWLTGIETIAGIKIRNKRDTQNGKVVFRDEKDWIVVENNHPALVSLERLLKIRDVLKSRSRAHKHAENESYLLTGLVKCKFCGGNMKGATSRNKNNGKEYMYHRYICSAYVSGYGCRYHAVHRDDLELKIIDLVKEIAEGSNADLVIKATVNQSVDERIKEINTQLAKISKRIVKQIQAHADDLISGADLKMASNIAESERVKLNEELKKLTKHEEAPHKVRQTATTILGDISGVDRIKAKNALRFLFERIEIENESISVVVKG